MARPVQDPRLIGEIGRAISGEYNAIQCYARLAKAAPDAETRKQILEIRQDEVRHYQVFMGIYHRLTGGAVPPITPEPCPRDFREGLRAAFKDEQETVDFYLSVGDRARDPSIRRAFVRAAQDEQNHAVWFLYFLSGK
ncbi:ferritin family protein [Salinithrix halophila]|uniref:Ferritin family protein n=1 Tax=Salinithrix halophila TaxID=1485204 RepID=A0ABV8JGE2_9BACL